MQTPSLHTFEALSPIDGRYAAAAQALRPVLSEAGLIRERIAVEARWFLALADEGSRDQQLASGLLGLRDASLPAAMRCCQELLAGGAPANAVAAVKAHEARVNHDVKAIEYYLRDQLTAAGASPAVLELLHFGCTSEDINNLAYASMLRSARRVLVAALDALQDSLRALADTHAELAMLARTHGQAASPTTLGKEIANVAVRIARGSQRLQQVSIRGKFNGAVGNFNAHVAALPQVDWLGISARFVQSFGLEHNTHTTQIEPHDWIAEYCDAVAAINVILIDFARDVWSYISLGYLRQRPVSGEVGSSTMPHKINPIDFENAEGNLGIANALLRHFADKLPVSRWQRDLTDSTVLRNLGVALAHSLIAWRAVSRGLSKIDPDAQRIAEDLHQAWDVLGEAVQTVMRAQGVPNGYEQLKAFTRGRPIDQAMIAAFIAQLPIAASQRERLAALTPTTYVGLAARLATHT